MYFYKFCVSPYIIPSCRFIPSCSTYAIDALNTLPVHKAIIKVLIRLCKCNPLYTGKKHDHIFEL